MQKMVVMQTDCRLLLLPKMAELQYPWMIICIKFSITKRDGWITLNQPFQNFELFIYHEKNRVKLIIYYRRKIKNKSEQWGPFIHPSQPFLNLKSRKTRIKYALIPITFLVCVTNQNACHGDDGGGVCVHPNPSTSQQGNMRQTRTSQYLGTCTMLHDRGIDNTSLSC